MERINFIPVGQRDLVPGEPLKDAIYDAAGVLLLRKGYVIRTDESRDRLLNAGAYFKQTLRPVTVNADEPINHRPDHPFDVVNLVEMALTRILKRTPDHRIGDTIFRQSQRLQQAVAVNADAAMASILLPTTATYSVRHGINAAILAEIVLKAMDVEEEERRSVLAACLTMNIGMHDIQDLLTYQEQPLNEAQRQVVKAHPRVGHELLAAAGVDDPIWLDAVLHHHEALDGSGYPDGLRDEQIGLGSRLLSLLDIFCARISPRGYRPGLLPNQVMAEIFVHRGARYDSEIPTFLVRELGVYPPGTVVELANGETAIVTRRGSIAQFPLVTAVLNSRGERLNAPIRRDTRMPDFTITSQTFLVDTDLTVNRFQIWNIDR